MFGATHETNESVWRRADRARILRVAVPRIPDPGSGEAWSRGAAANLVRHARAGAFVGLALA